MKPKKNICDGKTDYNNWNITNTKKNRYIKA